MTALTDITARLQAACAKAGRDPASVTLIAVSKVQPLDRVQAVLAQGHRVFGENKVQEAAGKWPDFRAQFPGVTLHLIGPLQTNKVRQAVALFDVIQTVDRPSLAQKLAQVMADLGGAPALMIQVNTGAEPQKAGVLPTEADRFIDDCRALGLTPQGLMCIPPESEDPAPHFQMLATLAARHGLPQLSMGMSADFEIAIAHGATHVRVGSALFGARVA